MRCPKCNKELPEDSKICKSCGKKKNKKKIIIAVVAGLLAVIIALSGFLIFNKFSNKSEEKTTASSENQTKNNAPSKPSGNADAQNDSNAPAVKNYALTGMKFKSTLGNKVDSEIDYNFNWSVNSLTENQSGSNIAKTIYEFNNEGNITKLIEGYIDDETNQWTPFLYHHEYIYNGGKLEKILSVDDDGAKNQETLKYDSNNNMTELTGYDDFGEVYSINTYEYDTLNRLTKVIIYDAEFIINYEENNVVTVQVKPYYDTLQGFSTITLKYNDFGKIEKCHYTFDPFEEVTCSYAYDENQNLTKMEFTSSYEGRETYHEVYEFEWKEGTQAQGEFSDFMIRFRVNECGAGFASYHYPIDYSPTLY